MNLRSVRKARSLWFVRIEDLNPHGLDIVPILAAVQARYRFQIHPTKPEHIYTQNWIEFARGTFGREDGGPVEIESMKIYQDGILADTRHSTDLSDLFIGDLLDFLVQRHSITFDPRMINRKAYLSQIIFSVANEIGSLSERLAAFSKLLTEQVGEGRVFEPTAIQFGTNPATGGELQFSIERQAAVPFEEHRYYSSAPLATDKHLDALKAWERLLVA